MKDSSKLNILSSSEIRSVIKQGISGIYIFCGPEEYMLESCLKMVKEKLLGKDDESGVFAYTRIDGDSDGSGGKLNFKELLNASSTVSLFCDRRLIEVRSVNFKLMNASETDNFCMLLGELSENKDNVVIFYARDEEIETGLIPKKRSRQAKPPPQLAVLNACDCVRCTTGASWRTFISLTEFFK